MGLRVFRAGFIRTRTKPYQSSGDGRRSRLPVGSGLSTYIDAGNQLHVYYIDADQHVSHLWWNTQTWQNEALRAKSRTSARAALGGSLTGYADADGYVHVFHFDAQPHVDYVWWNNQIWQSEDLTVLSKTNAVPAPASELSSFATASAAYVHQKFTGQERDSETGLDFLQARYYGAALGRFTSPDPANAGAA